VIVRRFVVPPICCVTATVASIALALAISSCSQPKSKVGTGAKLFRDEQISRAQLEELSNAFSDRYFTLMVSASERVMRGNPDMQQCRLMNGLRLLGVSSMYDIATSPDTLTQLVDQYVVVVLQNYLWVDSGSAHAIWGDRAQLLEENLRRAREDITALINRVFTSDQVLELDQNVAAWWARSTGAELVAYVRFSEVASSKGKKLIESVRDGGGLLEPLDRATEQVEEAKLAYERGFFWGKRLPLFANWQFEALAYDILLLPDVQRTLQGVNRVADVVGSLPALAEAQQPALIALMQEYQRSMQATTASLDHAAPLVDGVRDVMQASDGTLQQVNAALDKLIAFQAERLKHQDPNAPTAKPVEMSEIITLVSEARATLVEARQAIDGGGKLIGSTEIDRRLNEIQAAANASTDRIFWRTLVIVLTAIGGLGVLMILRSRFGGKT